MIRFQSQKSKIILLGIFFTLLLFSLTITCSNFKEEPFTIIQDPSETKILINASINITLINNQAETISSIFLYYCSLEPEFVCHFPSLEMEKNNQGHFFTVFTPEYEVNTILGYHLRINMENGSTVEIPNSFTHASDSSIRQGSDGNYYFGLLLVNSLTSENNTPWLSIECILALTLYRKKFAKKR